MRDTGCDRSSISESATQVEDVDPELVEDRFRVDRRILEQMLQAPEEDSSASAAALFFMKIMEETNTIIAWPYKLKIGAKSKKDPHIKVSGKAEAVKDAKERVMAVLDTRSSRVTLKIDVPFTDHSHIIGKGGNNIKRVMMDTGCHIHFPDSNRNNPMEKSNQVSIAGQPAGVEKARASIREFLPLVFSFDMPITGLFQPVPDIQSPFIQTVQQVYNVTVQFRPRPRVYTTTVVVRGNEVNAGQVMEGTRSLIEHMAGTTAVQVHVTMTMEVAQQHHQLVMGRNNCNVNIIMKQTATTIAFPAHVMIGREPMPRKSTVTITGLLEGVYMARQKLIGCLPLVLMFDMKDSQEVDATFISKLMEKFDVFISVKPKPKQPSRSVIIKGVERSAANLYETRRLLLGVEQLEPSVPSFVPSAYNLRVPTYGSGDTGMSLVSGLGMLGQNILSVNTSNSYFPSPLPSPMPPSPNGWSFNNYRGGCQQLLPQMPCFSGGQNASLDGMMSQLSLFNTPMSTPQDNTPSLCSSTTSTLSSPNPSPRQGSPVDIAGRADPDTHRTLPRHPSKSTGSVNRLQALLDGYKIHDDSTTGITVQDFSTVNGRDSCGYDGHTLEGQNQFQLDYDKKKMLAYKAMQQKPSGPESRTPNSSWSGYGFSKSMPESVIKERLASRQQALRFGTALTSLEDVKEESKEDRDPWKNSHSMTSNGIHRRKLDLNLSCNGYMDNGTNGQIEIGNTRKSDLMELLAKWGVSNYIDMFQQQEIDLATFLTLGDDELKELGISKYGPRRKMLLAIEFNKQSFRAAPGAERSIMATGPPPASASCW